MAILPIGPISWNAPRAPGRPTKKLVNDEGFARFYTIPTASTARDRLLLALKRNHPEHFAAVCRLECSPREAGIRAGLVKVGRWHYGGVCDITAAGALREQAQARLLCELFKVMAPNAQCTFIAREIEPRLEAGPRLRQISRNLPLPWSPTNNMLNKPRVSANNDAERERTGPEYEHFCRAFGFAALSSGSKGREF